MRELPLHIHWSKACRRSFDACGIDLGNFDVKRFQAAAHAGFVVNFLNLGELLLDHAEQFKGSRQHLCAIDLLAFGKLLDPPIWIKGLSGIREWLSGTRQIVEGAVLLSDTDLRVDP